MAKKNRKLRKAVKKAAKDGKISRKEIKRIMKIAPTAAKAVNRIAKSGATVKTSAANYAVQQARATPVTPRRPNKPVLGTSSLGKTLGSMAGAPGYKPTSSGQNLFIKGQNLSSKGKVVTGRPVQKTINQIIQDPGGGDNRNTEPVPNPNQVLLDRINVLMGTIDELTATGEERESSFQDRINELTKKGDERESFFQDRINQIQQTSQQQVADMSNWFNQALAEQQNMYAMNSMAAAELARQEEEAARAFMINQGRMASPANLQIGATYGTPKLAGTQGFKYRPQRTTTTTTPAQVASAFTAPTLAAAATQPVQTPVLNV